MTAKLYTIRDRVAQESGPLYQAKNDAVAKRQFDLMLAKNGLNEKEYVLLRVGSFDSETTLLIASQLPEEVVITVDVEVNNAGI